MILRIKNSFCHITGQVPEDLRNLIASVLTYQNDIGPEMGRLFYQLSLSKKLGNRKMEWAVKAKMKYLKDTEWVCWYRDDSFPTGHLNLVLEALRHTGTDIQIQDLRVRPEPTESFRWFQTPPPLRPYQEEALANALKEGRGVLEMSVGSGKTLVAANIIKELSVVSLYVVPSRGLLDQTAKELTRLFGPRKVQQIDAKAVRAGKKLKPIRIVTMQSMTALKKTGELDVLLGDIEALYVDESHHCGAKGWVDMIPDLSNIYFRFAFSGTYTRNDNKILDLWAYLSTTVYEYPAWQAIRDEYLTPMKVLVHEVSGAESRNYQKEYDNCYCGNPHLLEKIRHIIESAESTDQILILVNKKKKSGEIIHKVLADLGIPNSYISGDNKKEEITEAIEKFNDKSIRILIGSSVIAEGIDIRSSDHLINCKGNKSELVLVQAVGRLIRLYEGKEIGILHDFKFPRTNFMESHLKERISAYEENFRCPIVFV